MCYILPHAFQVNAELCRILGKDNPKFSDDVKKRWEAFQFLVQYYAVEKMTVKPPLDRYVVVAYNFRHVYDLEQLAVCKDNNALVLPAKVESECKHFVRSAAF